MPTELDPLGRPPVTEMGGVVTQDALVRARS
jgi:hypothetical protein